MSWRLQCEQVYVWEVESGILCTDEEIYILVGGSKAGSTKGW